MESPVVLDKPSEYSNSPNNERGFPFDEEDASGAWSQLAARHPDIAARLRARPQNWARKRRPNGQDDTEDFGDFFNDIPPEFREHLAPHFNRRHGPEYQQAFEQQQPQQQYQQQQPEQQYQQQPQQQYQQPQQYQQQQPQYQQPQHQYQQPQQQYQQPPQPYQQPQQQQEYHQQQQQYPQQQPQYQQAPSSEKQTSATQTEPVLEQTVPGRAMSAPPPERAGSPAGAEGNVRHIPIFVEGRDIPVVNRTAPAAPPPAHIDRDQYFADDGPTFHHPNFSRAFGSPFNKGFRQGPQPFTQQKAYPQAAFTRGQSPQRSQSPHMPPEEHYVKVPVHHEPPRPSPVHHEPPRPSPVHHEPPRPSPVHHEPPRSSPVPPQRSQPHPPPQQSSPPPQPQPKPQPQPNDPITQIVAIQTEVLNLMTDVENFSGSKKDKRYIYLDEMLTRNLIKLDNIETDGKENIRLARKEAIKCIQKCIAVLEAKADKGSVQRDVDMNSQAESPKPENGEVEMKETKEENKELQPEVTDNKDQQETTLPESITEQTQDKPSETTEASTDKLGVEGENKKEEKKPSPKKKVVKKRDKSKEANKQDPKSESMSVDDKGDKTSQSMEVDSTTTSQ